MPETKDLWYLRLPDGRTLRAVGVSVIRQQLASGRLPPETKVRRPGEEEWRPVSRFAEFADASTPHNNGTHPPTTVASRLDSARLHLAGARVVVDELLGALDSAIVSRKLWAATLCGLVLGGIAALSTFDLFAFTAWPPGLGWLLAVAALLVWSWLAVVLSKMTFTELSRLRPSQWADGLEGSTGATLRLAIAHGFILALLSFAIFALRFFPSWLLTLGDDRTTTGFGIISQIATVVCILAEMLLWPLILLTMPLAALIVVEQCSFVSALGQWMSLVWRQGRRLLMAEGLALGLGLLIAAPLALLALALGSRMDAPELALAANITRVVLYWMLGSVVLAYLVVANVFIYLNLRYEDAANG